MVLSNDDKYTPAERFNIGGVEINYVNYYKYLGIEVHKNVDMIPSAENLCVRSWKAIFRINTAIRGIDFDPSIKNYKYSNSRHLSISALDLFSFSSSQNFESFSNKGGFLFVDRYSV